MMVCDVLYDRLFMVFTHAVLAMHQSVHVKKPCVDPLKTARWHQVRSSGTPVFSRCCDLNALLNVFEFCDLGEPDPSTIAPRMRACARHSTASKRKIRA